MVVVVILGILAMIAVPRLQFAAVRIKRADGLVRQLITDLRRTRSLAIRDAATNTSGYRMTVNGSQYQIMDLDTSTVIESFDIDASIHVVGGTFDFGPLGNLLDGSDTQITVSSDNHTFTINVVPATGAATLTES